MCAARAEPMIESQRSRRLDMQLGTSIIAASSWPDAAVAISGVVLVTAVALMVIQQSLATWRTRMVVAKEEAYRRLAEQISRDLHEINERLGGSELPSDREEARR
jgi:hypothetical protein